MSVLRRKIRCLYQGVKSRYHYQEEGSIKGRAVSVIIKGRGAYVVVFIEF